jgi:hypothetical protein
MKVKLPDGSELILETPEEIEQYMILTGQKVVKTQAQILQEQISAAVQAAPVELPKAVGEAGPVRTPRNQPPREEPPAPLAPEPPITPWTKRRIADLELPALTMNILLRHEITTVGHLMRYSPNQLRELKAFTELNLAHVTNALRQRGLNLSPNPEPKPDRVIKTVPRVYFVSKIEREAVEVLKLYPETGLDTRDVATLLGWKDEKASRVVTGMARQNRVVRRLPGQWKYVLVQDAFTARFEYAYYPQSAQREWDYENGY